MMQLLQLTEIVNQIQHDAIVHPNQLLSLEYLQNLIGDDSLKTDVISELMNELELIDHDFIVDHQIKVLVKHPSNRNYVNYLYDYNDAVHHNEITPLTLAELNNEIAVLDLHFAMNDPVWD